MINSILITLSLVLLSVFPPYLGFLYSSKMITEIKKRGLIKGVIIFLISLLFISVLFQSIPLILVYCSIYGIMILFYFLFEKVSIKTWDKAFLITIISIVLIIGNFYMNRPYFSNLKELMDSSIWNSVSKLDKSIPKDEVFKMLKNFYDNSLFYLSNFIFLSHIFTYIIINKKKWEKDEFTYLYLVLYIIFFLLSKYGSKENYIVNNLRESIKYFYIFYGMKEFYVKLKNKSKLKFFSIGIAVLLYSIQPFIFFVYGGLKSFNLTKKEDKNV